MPQPLDPAPAPPHPPHLIALLGAVPAEAAALAAAVVAAGSPFRLHPLPGDRPAQRLAALEPLGFAGAVLVPLGSARTALESAARSSLDAADAGAADTWTVSPSGLLADLSAGRGLARWLERQRWNAPGATAAIVGTGALARAFARELGSLGVAEVAVLGPDRPEAEASLPALPAGSRGFAHALDAPDAAARLRHADLVLRLIEAPLPEECYAPHLTLIDLVDDPLSRARARAIRFGATTANRHDLAAYRLAEALRRILGTAIAPDVFLAALHAVASSAPGSPAGES